MSCSTACLSFLCRTEYVSIQEKIFVKKLKLLLKTLFLLLIIFTDIYCWSSQGLGESQECANQREQAIYNYESNLKIYALCIGTETKDPRFCNMFLITALNTTYCSGPSIPFSGRREKKPPSLND